MTPDAKLAMYMLAYFAAFVSVAALVEWLGKRR